MAVKCSEERWHPYSYWQGNEGNETGCVREWAVPTRAGCSEASLQAVKWETLLFAAWA